MKGENYIKLEFPSRSVNEGFARAAARPSPGSSTPPRRAGRHQDGGQRGRHELHRPRLPGQPRRITMRLRILDGGHAGDFGEGRGRRHTRRREGARALFTTGGEERSGMGFTIMESFTDRLGVRSPSRPRHDRDDAPQDSATGQMTAGAALSPARGEGRRPRGASGWCERTPGSFGAWRGAFSAGERTRRISTTSAAWAF